MSQTRKTIKISRPLPYGYTLSLPLLFDILRGDTVDLNVFYENSQIPDGLLTYEVTKPTVARIDDNGIFLAINAGTTEIIIRHPDFTIKTWCVVRPSVTVDEDLFITPDNPSLNIGDTVFLKLQSQSVVINNSDVQWFSPENGTIVQLSKNGYLVALRDGVFSVRAKYVGVTVELFGRVEGEVIIPENQATPARINEAICGRAVCDIVDVVTEDVEAVYTYSVRLTNMITDFRLLKGQEFIIPYIVERSDKYGNKVEITDILSSTIEVLEDPYNVVDIVDYRTIQINESGGAKLRINYKGIYSDVITIRSEVPVFNIIRGNKEEYPIRETFPLTLSVTDASGNAVYLFDDDLEITARGGVDAAIVNKRNHNTFDYTPKMYKDVILDVTYRGKATGELKLFTPIDYNLDFELAKTFYKVKVGTELKLEYRIRRVFDNGTIGIVADEPNAILFNTNEDPAIVVQDHETITTVDVSPKVEVHVEYSDGHVQAISPRIPIEIVEDWEEGEEPAPADVWALTFEKSSFTMKVGDPFTLKYTVTKNGEVYTDPIEFDYIFDIDALSRVGDTFTTLKSGEYTIQLSTPFLDSPLVTVIIEDATIQFAERNFTMFIGAEKTMSIVDNFGTELTGFTLISADRAIVAVEGMKVTAMRVGEAIITATNEAEGLITSTLITVEPVPVITFHEPVERLYIGDSATMTIKDRFGVVVEAADYTITSSHPEIISVEGNVITSVTAGASMITATMGELTAEVQVLSVQPSIAFPTEELTIDVGNSELLTLEDDAGNPVTGFTLESEDPSIVRVTEYPGVVEAVAQGMTMITATKGSMTASVIITVVGLSLTSVDFSFVDSLASTDGSMSFALDPNSTDTTVVFEPDGGLAVAKNQRFNLDNGFMIPFTGNLDLEIDAKFSMDRTRAHVLGTWNDIERPDGPKKLTWLAFRNSTGGRKHLEIQDINARNAEGAERIDRCDIDLPDLTDELWIQRAKWKIVKRGLNIKVYRDEVLFGEKTFEVGVSTTNQDNVNNKFDSFNNIYVGSISAPHNQATYQYEGTIYGLKLWASI